MKVLCLCWGGFVRSVTLAGMLRFVGYDTLAAGMGYNSPETVALLCAWADRIYAVHDDECFTLIPEVHRAKARVLAIGPDVYGRPWHPALKQKIETLLTQEELRWLGPVPTRS